MTKNPLINAAGAITYIIVLANLMNFMSKNTKDSFITPVLVLSMLTLSAAAMAYFFFFQPFQLFFDNKKKQAIDLAFKSFAALAGFTVLILVLVISKILH